MSTIVQINPNVISYTSTPKKFLIDGQCVNSQSEKVIEVFNPSTGEVITTVPQGGKEDVELAVRAARKAYEEGPWPAMKPNERARLIMKLAALLEKHREEFSQLDPLDMGLPISVAPFLLELGMQHLEYYAGWTTKLTGETMPVSSAGNYFAYTSREPIGIVGAITSWNGGVASAIKKIAPALATGNTIVLKPSELAPLSALRLGELVQEAGFPDGVLNLVTGFADVGSALVEHPEVDMVAFTGSTVVGKEIIKASAGTVKKLLMELGGKSAHIIFADSDYELAIKNAAHAIFRQSGQVCFGGSRLFVEKKIYDKFLSDLAEYTKTIKVGHCLDKEAFMGPLISKEHRNRVLNYVHLAQDDGAEVLCGGSTLNGVEYSNGFFMKPTVLANVNNSMRVCQEEIFGPVLAAMPFDSEEEVIRLANRSNYGLGGGISTTNLGKAHRIAHALKTGNIWINSYGLSDPAVPFGGYKQSGIGKEHASASIDMYTETKSVWVNLDV